MEILIRKCSEDKAGLGTRFKVPLKDHLFTDTLLTPHSAFDLDHKFRAEAPLNLKTYMHRYYEV